MTNDSTVIEIINLHPYEVNLLRALRSTFRFGEVTIIMRDGLPFRLKRITEFENLAGGVIEMKEVEVQKITDSAFAPIDKKGIQV